MCCGTLLKQLFVKDLRTTWRHKFSLSFHVFLMLCVPLLWYGGYQYFDSVLKTANGVRRYEEHGIIPIYENSKNIMNADLEFLTLENLPEDFVKALKAKCKRKHAKNDEKILINITSFTRNALEYEIIIPNKDQKYSNHRGFVPNIFGTLKDGVTEPSFHLGTPISEYTEASKAQMCVDSVYLSWTKVDSMNLTIYAKKIGDAVASDLGLLLTYELNFVRTAYPLLLVVSLMLSTIELCKEKENQIPTYLMTMGNHRIFFYLSHWLFMLFKTWLFIVPAGFAVAIYFWRSGIGLIACVLIVLMAHVLIGVCLFASTLFKDSNYVSYSIIALYSASYVVHMFLSDYVTVFDFYGALIISTFNPYSAYAYAFDHLFIVLQFDQEMRYFEDSEYYLPLTFPIVMLTIQSIIYTLLAFYLDLVLPIDDSPKIHPLFFLGFRKKSSPLTNEEIELCRGIVIPPDEDSANIEEQEEENYGQFGAYIETEPSARNPVVNVHRLIKKWNKSDIALKGISFKIYKGQITVLLGHNGSGKTTLFNCLTGLTNPTGGLIRIYGVPPKTYGHEKRISFLPEWEPFFPYLTVKEHLLLYGSLRNSNETYSDDIDELLKLINLEEEKNIKPSKLSSNMKKMLCLGISLSGNSNIVILDEPTTGMDLLSRKQMLKVINDAKKKRTIIFSTRFMDEVEDISDRIIMLSKGEIICDGSIEFIKARFGTGLIMTIEFESNTEDDNLSNYYILSANVLNLSIQHCDGARIDGPIGKQFNILLPNNAKRKFPSLFEALEDKKGELKIESFDVSVNSLEHAFSKVTNLAEPKDQEDQRTNLLEKFLEAKSEVYYGFSLYLNQMKALLIRRFHYIRRNWQKFIILYLFLFVPLLFLLIFEKIVHDAPNNPTTKSTKLDGIKPSFKIISYLDFSSWERRLKNQIEKSTNSGNLMVTKFEEKMLTQLPPIAFGFQQHTVNSITILHRNVFQNGIPTALNMLSNIFGNITTKITIKEDFLYDGLIDFEDVYVLRHFLITTISTFAIPLIFSWSVILPIEEQYCGIYYSYTKTRLSSGIYWLSSFLVDYFIGIFTMSIIGILLFLFNIFHINCLIAYIVATGIFSITFLFQAYVTTFFFDTSSMAISVLHIYNLIMFSVIESLRSYVAKRGFDFHVLVHILFPTKPLMDYFFNLSIQCRNDAQINNPFSVCDVSKQTCGAFYFSMITLDGFIWLLILIILENYQIIHGFLVRCCYTKSTKILKSEYEDDEEVAEERTKVMENDTNNYAILMCGLTKIYSEKIVVNNLTIGISSGECFGLLGPNGAGKSTIFKMLGGKIPPNDGYGIVDGCDITKNAILGYCPQKDALLPKLTVYETLILFARLRGIVDGHATVQLLLASIELDSKHNTLVKHCSAGEKRKLSIGIAMIMSTKVMMLDDPTADVDPRTRRHIWDIILSLKKFGTSTIMTTHSMEECETLCSRVGFLNNGILVSIGNCQHLKNRFGNNYMIKLTVETPGEEIATTLTKNIFKEFGAKPVGVDGVRPTLSWTFPRTDEPLSLLYRRLIRFIDENDYTSNSSSSIKDFALVGTSLEEVFMEMTRLNSDE